MSKKSREFDVGQRLGGYFKEKYSADISLFQQKYLKWTRWKRRHNEIKGEFKKMELKEWPFLDSLLQLTAIWNQSFLLGTWKRNDNETMLSSCLGSS